MTYADIETQRGDTFRRRFLFATGTVPEDITGWTIFFTIKNQPSDPDADAVLKKDIATHTDPAGGESELVLTAAETDALTNLKYFYDIQLKKADGDVRTILKGLFIVKPDITRRTS